MCPRERVCNQMEVTTGCTSSRGFDNLLMFGVTNLSIRLTWTENLKKCFVQLTVTEVKQGELHDSFST